MTEVGTYPLPVVLPQLSLGTAPDAAPSQATTPGLCNNFDYCSVGLQRIVVRAPIGEPFACPECGTALRPPGNPSRVRQAVIMQVLRLATLVAGMTMSLCFGYSLGRVQPVVAHTVTRAADAVQSVLSPPPVAPTSAPDPALASAAQVAGRAYPAHASPVDSAAPPPHLLHETRFGQVTLDCTMAAIAANPSCRVADIRGGDAFSAPAADWLRHLAVRYAPDGRAGAPTLQDHRWRIVFQDYSGALKPAH